MVAKLHLGIGPWALVYFSYTFIENPVCLLQGRASGLGVTKLGQRSMARPGKEDEQREKAHVLGWG